MKKTGGGASAAARTRTSSARARWTAAFSRWTEAVSEAIRCSRRRSLSVAFASSARAASRSASTDSTSPRPRATRSGPSPAATARSDRPADRPPCLCGVLGSVVIGQIWMRLPAQLTTSSWRRAHQQPFGHDSQCPDGPLYPGPNAVSPGMTPSAGTGGLAMLRARGRTSGRGSGPRLDQDVSRPDSDRRRRSEVASPAASRGPAGARCGPSTACRSTSGRASSSGSPAGTDRARARC